MKFLREREALEFLGALGCHGRIDEVKESKRFPGLLFWNATGSEDCPDFPTFYFRKPHPLILLSLKKKAV